jgi:hypothetical protein
MVSGALALGGSEMMGLLVCAVLSSHGGLLCYCEALGQVVRDLEKTTLAMSHDPWEPLG